MKILLKLDKVLKDCNEKQEQGNQKFASHSLQNK